MEAVDRFTWERMVRATKMDPSTKLAALICATYASQDGTKVRPGLKRLSEDAGLSPRTMKRALVALRSMGLLDRVSKGSNLGVKDMVDVYRLVIPAANQVTPTSPGQVTPTSPGDTSDTNQVTPVTEPGDTHVPLPSQSPSQLPNHLSPGQLKVASLLGLAHGDERLGFVDQMMKEHDAKGTGWLITCHRNGDLDRLLEEAAKPEPDAWLRGAKAEPYCEPCGRFNGKHTDECPNKPAQPSECDGGCGQMISPMDRAFSRVCKVCGHVNTLDDERAAS